MSYVLFETEFISRLSFISATKSLSVYSSYQFYVLLYMILYIFCFSSLLTVSSGSDIVAQGGGGGGNTLTTICEARLESGA